MPSKKIDFDLVRELALALPQVEPGTIHGVPSLKVHGKLLCCVAIHSSAEADTLAVQIGRSERAKLVEANPSAYYVTEHYLNYEMVLVRMSQIDRKSLQDLLNRAWKFVSAPATPRSQPTRRRRSDKDA